jgi:TetR/AcrR family transcriptional regulator
MKRKLNSTSRSKARVSPRTHGGPPNRQVRVKATVRKGTAPDKSAAPRKRGRPRKTDGLVRSTSVLEAARQLLSSRRLVKLTHTEVARAARVDEKLVRYYYETSELLLDAILDLDIDSLNQVMIQASKPQDSVKNLLKNRVENLIDFVDLNPHFFRLLVDFVYGGRSGNASGKLANVSIEAYARNQSMVALGRSSGEFRKDFDPRLLYIAIIGMAEIFVTARPVLDLLYGGEVAGLRDAYKDFVVNLVLRGVQAEGGTGGVTTSSRGGNV